MIEHREWTGYNRNTKKLWGMGYEERFSRRGWCVAGDGWRLLLALLDILREPLQALKKTFAGRGATRSSESVLMNKGSAMYNPCSPWMNIPGSFAHSVQTQLFGNFSRCHSY